MILLKRTSTEEKGAESGIHSSILWATMLQIIENLVFLLAINVLTTKQGLQKQTVIIN